MHIKIEKSHIIVITIFIIVIVSIQVHFCMLAVLIKQYIKNDIVIIIQFILPFNIAISADMM